MEIIKIVYKKIILIILYIYLKKLKFILIINWCHGIF